RAIAARLGLGAAQSWSAEEAIAAWGRNMAVFSLGSNSRIRGKAAADLGWSPRPRSVTQWIADELGLSSFTKSIDDGATLSVRSLSPFAERVGVRGFRTIERPLIPPLSLWGSEPMVFMRIFVFKASELREREPHPRR